VAHRAGREPSRGPTLRFSISIPRQASRQHALRWPNDNSAMEDADADRPPRREFSEVDSANAASAEKWVNWLLVIAGVVLPIFIIELANYVVTLHLSWSPIALVIKTGLLLIPTMLLSVDAAHRWYRSSRNNFIYGIIRTACIALSVIVAAIALLAIGIVTTLWLKDSAVVAHTFRHAGQAVTRITLAGLVLATFTSLTGALQSTVGGGRR